MSGKMAACAVTVHDVALDVDDVAWAAQQMWAPDAAEKDGKYYLYFPAKDPSGVFYIGAAVSDTPTGPFTAEADPIAGSFSMDPSVFEDTDGAYYMYFGGIWGGQLQRWATGEYDADPALNMDLGDDEAPSLMPKIAKMGDDMIRNTHKVVYATGDNPYGPFTYQGVVLDPVEGWTNHHSIFSFDDQYYLAFHDIQLSGKNNLRNVKITPLTLNADGKFETVDPMPGD